MTAAHAVLISLIPPAYLLGSVPFGLLVGLARGVDPRKAGSGNIGATNVGRLLGGRYFALVFLLDLLKGLVPVAIAGVTLARLRAPGAPLIATDCLLWLLVGFASITGHMFSLFLKFKGGKGVATSCGVILGVFPYYTLPAVAAIAAWVILFKTTRYVSVASMGGTGAFGVAYVVIGLIARWPILGEQLPLLAFAIIVPLMIVWKHRGNLARLRAGTENRFAAREQRA